MGRDAHQAPCISARELDYRGIMVVKGLNGALRQANIYSALPSHPVAFGKS